jgi:4-hydroxy-tetrahydrodipicolinate reductase
MLRAPVPMRIVIVGNGKMGKAVAALAEERGHVVQAMIGGKENPAGQALTRERLEGAEVAIEFTRPDAVVTNLERLVAAGIPTVTGTTGWDEQLSRITRLVESRGGSLLHAANFSVGVQLFLRAAADLSRRFVGRPGFEAYILEQHHAAKIDSPSGTAKALQARVHEADPEKAFPIVSIRAGAAPGSHVLTYDSPFETVSLSHVARNRLGFAEGALLAAEWLPGHPGVHTFDTMVFGDSE